MNKPTSRSRMSAAVNKSGPYSDGLFRRTNAKNKIRCRLGFAGVGGRVVVSGNAKAHIASLERASDASGHQGYGAFAD
jgi:hypothetical protein